jgi:hypothetical protein
MTDTEAIKAIVQELGERDWDVEGITARFRNLQQGGIPQKSLKKDELLVDREEILDRVQRRAEEYNFITKNCAQGTALALMEEFGVGNMDVIKAGEICGGITGSLITFGLIFGGDDPLDFETVGPTMMIAQKFISYFEDEVGYIHCANILEVIFGWNMDPGASQENMEAFANAKGFEKCGYAPGIGARLAAGFIIDNIK